MAYAALISLAGTIDRILNQDLLPISLEEKQQIISLREHVTPFEAFLDKFPDKFNSLEGRMREVTNEAEDILEYLVLEIFYPSSSDVGKHGLQLLLEKVMEQIYLIAAVVLEKVYPSTSDDGLQHNSSEKHGLQLQLEKVMEQIYLIAAEVKVLEEVMDEIDFMAGEVKNINHSSQLGADSSAISPSSTAPPTHEGAVVGFEDYVEELKDRLCGEESKLQVIPICGMGGIGKTTLARKVFEDPLIMEEFVIRVWVTISQDYSAQRIISSLLESLKEFNTGLSGSNEEEKVRKILWLRKYLIVMDDMWSSDAWDALKRVFPDVGNGSCIMITTRLSYVALYPNPSRKLFEMQLMDADQSWSLLKQKVFMDNDFPELENIGKEIARSCRGLPLAIVVIAGLLSSVDKNPASWKEIAKKVKSVETTEQEQIESILSLSYTHLPQYLRPCFMYMGSFREDEEINVSRLIRLWVAEGFLKHPNANRCESLEEEAEECLEDLVKRNLVLVKKRKWDGRTKSCSLHDLMRDLSIRKARQSKFLLSFLYRNVEEGYFIERVKNERRVSADSSSLTLFSSIHGSTIHTIMCSGPGYSSEKLEFVKNVGLLRVLEAESIDMDSLPDQLCHLLHLRYLAIRYDVSIPVFPLPNLQNLQTLIVHPFWKIPLAPAEHLRVLWSMPQLRHVYFDGIIDFDDPRESDSPLENLQTVSSLSIDSCTKRILKMIPCLKKLKIVCFRGFFDYGVVCLDDLVHLEQLQSLEIFSGYWVGRCTFRMMLKKLCLRRMIFPWKEMITAGSLPDLRVLKLKDCNYDGSTWETTEGQFPQLEILVIENCRCFENWITESSHFPRLKRLLLHDCRYLKGIPNDIGEIPTLELIEIKGRVTRSLVESAEEIQREQEDFGNNTLQVQFVSIHVREFEC